MGHPHLGMFGIWLYVDQLKTREILRCPGTQVDILGLMAKF